MSSESITANSKDDIAFLSEQLQQLAMDQAFENDLELAFRLQMDEAIAASAALQASSSSLQPFSSSVTASLQLPFSAAINHPSPSFSVSLKPSSSGGGSSVHPEAFRLYFKGLVCDEIIEGSKVELAGIGVSICDSMDNQVFQLQKPWVLNNETSRQVMEFKALIEGLNSVLTLGVKQITIVSDYFSLYQFIRRRWTPRQRKISVLIDEVRLLCRRFDYCGVTLVARNDIKFAFKLARDAIISQITKANVQREPIETCIICLEGIAASQMLAVPRCGHPFCSSCMKQHGEVKLLHGTIPRCPHEGCNSEMDAEFCERFLSPKFMEMMRQRVKEAGVPVTERVYCPHPRCSALMTRSEATQYAENALGCARSGTRKCIKCHGLFCIDCRVPWHGNLSCDEYKKLNPFPSGEDEKLKSLATKNLWRQCAKCNHIIELSEGCYHMTCRCGHEFCYTCGAEWKNKKATCTCPIWSEENIIHDEDNIIYDEDDESDFYDEDSTFEDEDGGGSSLFTEDDGGGSSINHGEDDGNTFHVEEDWSESGEEDITVGEEEDNFDEGIIVGEEEDGDFDDGEFDDEDTIIIDEEDEQIMDDEPDYGTEFGAPDDENIIDDEDVYTNTSVEDGGFDDDHNDITDFNDFGGYIDNDNYSEDGIPW